MQVRGRAIAAYVALAVVLFAASVAFVAWRGGEYAWSFDVSPYAASTDDLQVQVEQDAESMIVADRQLEDGIFTLTLRAQERGRATVIVTAPDDASWIEVFHVHSLGIITKNTFFGPCYGYGAVLC